jgi:hypothetical protein
MWVPGGVSLSTTRVVSGRTHAPRGEPVDMGRLDDRMAVSAGGVVEVIDGDEQHVHPAGRGTGRAERRSIETPKALCSGTTKSDFSWISFGELPYPAR